MALAHFSHNKLQVNIPQVTAAVQRPPPRQYYANAKNESMRVKTKHFEARTAEAISQSTLYYQG